MFPVSHHQSTYPIGHILWRSDPFGCNYKTWHLCFYAHKALGFVVAGNAGFPASPTGVTTLVPLLFPVLPGLHSLLTTLSCGTRGRCRLHARGYTGRLQVAFRLCEVDLWRPLEGCRALRKLHISLNATGAGATRACDLFRMTLPALIGMGAWLAMPQLQFEVCHEFVCCGFGEIDAVW